MQTDPNLTGAVPPRLNIAPAVIQDRIILRCFGISGWSPSQQLQAVAGAHDRILKLQLEHDGVSAEKLMCWKEAVPARE